MYKLMIGFRAVGEFVAADGAEAARKARQLISESGLDDLADTTEVTTIDPQGMRWVSTLGRFRAP